MYKTIAREKNTTIVQQQPILNKRLQLPKVNCKQIEKVKTKRTPQKKTRGR
jgi:hypothetical protein